MFYNFLKKFEDLGLKNQIGKPSIDYKDNLRVLCHVYDPVARGPLEQEDWLGGALCSDTKFSPDKVLGDDPKGVLAGNIVWIAVFAAVLVKQSSSNTLLLTSMEWQKRCQLQVDEQ